GGQAGVDDAVVLRRVDQLGMSSVVILHRGHMEVRFGRVDSVEALPRDTIQVTAALCNDHWGRERATMRPGLEISVHLLRVVCTNGAYIQRGLADARLVAWANEAATN